MTEPADDVRFEQEIVPHLGAAYNLARWLTGSSADADDVVQEAAIKAFRFIKKLNSKDAKPFARGSRVLDSRKEL